MRSVPPETSITPPAAAARHTVQAGSAGASARYRDNLARHLIGIARDLQNRLMAHLGDDCGYADLRPSLGPLLTLVRIEPRPSSALATALAISPQACSQLINHTEKAGYVERRADARDRRSKVVHLTPLGRRLVDDASEIILAIDADYRSLVGTRAYRRLTEALAALFEGLGIPTHDDAGFRATSRATAAVLPLISVQIQQDLMRFTTARGHRGLKMSHGQVLPLIGQGGARVHQIARIHCVSRQAISTTARDLESLGYVRGETDPHDGRGIVLRLTQDGEGLIRDSVAAADDLEKAFGKILGDQKLAQLRTIARKLYLALHLEEEIFDVQTSAPRVALPKPARSSKDLVRAEFEMERLASELQQKLGRQGAARLAAALTRDVASDTNSNDPSGRRSKAAPTPRSRPVRSRRTPQ